MSLRTGIGTDAHRFSPDPSRPLRLCLLTWPGERALDGHSDGDVAAHAIVDALASAVGLGDIGALFGTADPRFTDADSSIFLAQTVRALTASGMSIVNVAVQVVGNRPAISARRDEAQARLTEALGAPVNVSGTTTDTLGFTGRGEGIAAIATCLIEVREL
jgi:2-C-methyl-D-erythritol 4-phosphate cytidylyltransferase/2-C-methyl-D-erythritol 2,4-cyclodiphosphate synthase